ncbi:hypothetical protein IV203_006864 [Nitzschia inconspicua]|uniref:YqaJ viral recombinase domain-containing protein n=2 Tax=Nitzschia inconspicua TaxID=303405 RepID=A0A9K3PBQ6_9STRA|nr:hypothetical protein IV203_006864 [Nitzschia inconspicua]
MNSRITSFTKMQFTEWSYLWSGLQSVVLKTSATRSCVEGMILQSAEPLTTGQRCADWFLMKSMLISGTMAGEIAQTVDLNTLRMSDEGLTNLLQDCIASWFGRHKGTAMMAAGSRNEEPTIQKLRSSVKFIQVIYDVGLLRWRNNRCIGVSPDAVCLISVAGKTQPVPCCLEIKSRLADTTVRRAESSATKHGSVVNCVFGDDTFKDCVPAENRAQVVHQALVTQFDYGLFVTSKVQGGEGSLVQVVVIEIPASIRMTHGLVLCAVATPLLGFLHGEHVVKRGVLIDDDFPPWVTVPQKAILKSRAKLYFAHLKLITMADGTVKPTQPLLLYKHSVQHRYNKQKPGLDMNTELSDRVAFNSKGSFESKYVFRMLDAILVNSWRAHQAVFDVAPWMATLAEPPTLAQVRRKLHGAETIEDYVWYTSTASLAELASLKRSNLAIPNLRDDSPAGALFMQEFQRYRENNVWPMRRGALEKFIKDPFLKRLRTASFPGCEHKSGRVHELVNKASEGARRKCILCFVSKKDVPEASRLHGRGVSSNSSFMCTTCMVCLCKKKIGGSTAKSCYEVWHERKNLALEATKQRKRLLESREQEDAEKRRKLSANANSQKKSPSKSPGPSQDAQFQEDREQPDEDELVEEDQEDELDGDNTDEQDIEEEEIGEQYYDDVYFSSDIDSLEDSTGEEEEDSE